MICTTAHPAVAEEIGDRHGVPVLAGQTISFAATAGTVIRCRSGSVWLTPGDGRDVGLYAGDSHVVTRPAKAVVWAMENSLIEVGRR